MRLSDLIFYREKIDQYSCQPTEDLVSQNLSELIDGVNQRPIEVDGIQGRLESDLIDIKNSIHKFDATLKDFRAQINQEISSRHQEYFNISYKNYNEAKSEPIENIRDRELRIDQSDLHLLKHRLRSYSDWKHPGAFIRPSNIDLFKEVVDCDPFYILDIDHELLKPCLESVNPLYANRLRSIVFDDRRDIKLSALPKNQFGFIFAWNFLNYKPLEVIKEYFESFIELLKPGGTLVFTFNDCDRSLPVKLVENAFASYTPGSMLETMAQAIGYEVVYRHKGSYHCNWLEIKRPGILTSLKGGQSLAKIVANATESTYNNLGLESVENQRIRAAAKKLGIPGWNKDSAKSLEEKVIEEELKVDAKILNIPGSENMSSKELRRAIKSHNETQELKALRQMAIDRGIDTPTNIRYGYSLEKLRIVTKDWRKEE